MKLLKKLPDKELDSVTLSFWHDISENPCLTKLLNYCEYNLKDKYSESRPESIHAHIQLERLGGRNGWNKLRDLLINPPDIEKVITPNSVTEKPRKKKRYEQEEFSYTHTD